MDGTARLSVDPDIMGYILHCMYSSLWNVTEGLRVTLLWRKNDDTVMLSSTSRPATRDLHIALNRYFLLYNSVKKNLIHTTYRLPARFENNLFYGSEVGRLRSVYKGVHIQESPKIGEIKLCGFEKDVKRAFSGIFQTPQRSSHGIQNAEKNYSAVGPAVRQKSDKTRTENDRDRNKIFESSKKKSTQSIISEAIHDNTASSRLGGHVKIVYSKSFEKRLAKTKNSNTTVSQLNGVNSMPPTSVSTAELHQIQRKTAQINKSKKTSTFPYITTNPKMSRLKTKTTQITTQTGVIISACLYDTESLEGCDVHTTEITPDGRLCEIMMWIIAKSKCFSVLRTLKLHMSMYGTMSYAKVIVTPGFELPFKYLIHAVTPQWNARNTKKCLKQLYNMYRNVLQVASRDITVRSISLPILGRNGSEASKFSQRLALAVFYQSIVAFLKSGPQTLRHIRVLCFSVDQLHHVTNILFSRFLSVTYDKRFLQQEQIFYNNYITENDLTEEKIRNSPN